MFGSRYPNERKLLEYTTTICKVPNLLKNDAYLSVLN